MRKGKTDTSVRKTIARVSLLVLGLGLGMSLLISGGTFAKWTAAIVQMTGSNIQIGDWVAVEPPVISSDSKLPDGSVGSEYRYQFEATNSENATWSTWNLYGKLPSGLTLSKDGLLSGTPTYYGSYGFEITVENSVGKDSHRFTLVIHPVAPVFDESQVLPDAFDGTPYKSVTLNASSNSKTYEITSGSLPNGLTLSTYGEISGTPRGHGTFTFTVKVSNSGGSDSKEFTINLDSDFPYITTTNLPDHTIGTYYYQLVSGTGPSPTYAVTNGALPPGMSIDAVTGRITGYSTNHGVSHFTISRSNSLGTDTKELSIRSRYAAPTITTNSMPTVRKNVSYSRQLEGVGEESTFAISEGRLPAGITLDSVTGLVSGTATELGDFNVTITRTNESGVATKTFSFQSLLAVPVITTEYRLPDAYLAEYYELQNTATGEEIVWSATNLPDGLSINASTGLISGTPTALTAVTVSITATNSGGTTTSRNLLSIKNVIPEIVTETMPAGEVGTAYSETFSASGKAVSYSTSGTIPPGLKFNTLTGELSGIPTKSGTFNVTFTARNGGGSVNQLISIVIERDAPTINETSFDTAMQGVNYTGRLSGRGEDSKYSLTAGTLPPGINVNASYDFISGTPNANAHGSYTFTITKTNSVGSFSREFTLNVVHQTPTLTGSGTMIRGYYGVAYSQSLTGIGNGSTYTVINGALPEGITINESTGVISGIATGTGDFTFTVQKVNESGTVSKDYTFKLTHVAPRMISTAYERSTVGVPYSMQLNANGLDVTYSVTNGKLPDGITLDPSTGIISGTVDTSTTSGHGGTVRIDVTNSGGSSYISTLFYIDEVVPIITTTSLPQGVVGDPYFAKIEAVGENMTYSASNLSNGLKFDSSTGVISGTPTSAGSFTAYFTVRNSGNVVQQRIPMTVVTQAPTITTETLPDWTTGKTYSQTIAGVGTSNTFSITDGELPPGLRFNTSSGAITGTPTTRGDYTFTMTKTNVTGTVSKDFTIKIRYNKPTITTNSAFAIGTIGKNYTANIIGTGEEVTYSVIDGELPPGVSLNPNDTYLQLAGIPTAVGNYTFTIRKSNLDGEVSREFSITVNHVVPSITTSTLPDITAGLPYEFALAGSGEESTYTLKTGVLPEGISFNTDTGVFSGTTHTVGSFAITVSKTNSGGSSNNRNYTMKVIAAPAVTAQIVEDEIEASIYSQMIVTISQGTTVDFAELMRKDSPR